MLPGINVNFCLSHEGVWYAEHYGWPDYMEGKYKQEQQMVILKSLSIWYLYSSYSSYQFYFLIHIVTPSLVYLSVIPLRTIFGPPLSILYMHLLFNTRIKFVMWTQSLASYPVLAVALSPICLS